jgi:RsiW-degrading membrane proteinase PrsW (M82 family)
MICGNCGAQVREGSKYCTQCGSPVAINPLPYVQQPQAVVQQPQGSSGEPAQGGPQSGDYVQQPYMQQGPTYAGNQNGPASDMQSGPQQGPVPGGQQGYQAGQIPPSQPYVEQKQTFVVRRMPIIVIIVLTLGFFISGMFMEDGSMNVAAAVSCIPGIVLMFLIYKLDNIEPEPVGLLVKLFLAGGFVATIAAMLIEMVLDGFINIFFSGSVLLYCFAEAFILAAATEELCKYACLKFLTWKHPAFNYRFDGVVYSTAVAIGFDVIENLLYLVDSTADTAFIRAAFPGHCVFGIYMVYYYGQAKTLELNGDIKGAKAMRKKGVLTAILIHGFYDFICFIGGYPESELIQLLISIGLVLLMVVLNVTAYKNIKKFAYNDTPV